MKISQKVVLTVTAVIVVYTVMVFAVLKISVAPQFTAIEMDEAKKDFSRARSALDREINAVASYSMDYARWDDMYNYIAYRDPAFITGNFNYTAMKQQNIDYACIMDLKGHIIYSMTFRSADKPFTLKDQNDPASPLGRFMAAGTSSPDDLCKGILTTSEGLMLVSSCRIVDSSLKMPPRGRMISGRFFNEEEVASLRDRYKIDLTFHILPAEESIIARYGKKLEESNAEYFVREQTTITGYGIVHDVNNEKALVMRLNHKMTFAGKGLMMLNFAIVALIGCGIILLSISIIFLTWKIIKPIQRLTAWTSEITYLEDFHQRLPDNRHDEIGTLAGSFNNLLHKLSSINETLEQRVIQRTLALEKSNAELILLGKVFENSLDAIIITDEKGIISNVNPAFTKITGFESADVIGKLPMMLKSDRHEDAFYKGLIDSLNAYGRWAGELWAMHNRGRVCPEWISISSINNHEGSITHYMGVFHDISDAKQQESYIKYQAYHDPLTGLPNRALLYERMNRAILRSDHRNISFALLFLDLDHFKNINDSLGHEYGDVLLQHVSERLEKLVRASDTVARLGGDEFIIMLEDLTEDNQPAHLAERIISTFSEPFEIKEQIFHIGTSIGIALYPEDGADVGILIRNADTAMYRAKEDGRMRFHFFTNELNERVAKKLKMETDLRTAIVMDQFEVFYQPKINIRTGEIEGFEGLSRWRKDKLLVSPADFIPLAEETGLIISLDKIILEKACTEFAALNYQREKPYRLALNSTAKAMQILKFPNQIKEILAKTGMKPEWLEIEITETGIMMDIEACLDVIHRIADMGITIALDDFGTGYSSLSQLNRIPVNTLKIDRSFIVRIDDGEPRTNIIESINQMAKDLKMKVVAEGVETEAQLKYLKAIDCDMIQGFLISKPIPFNLVGDFVSSFKNMR